MKTLLSQQSLAAKCAACFIMMLLLFFAMPADASNLNKNKYSRQYAKHRNISKLKSHTKIPEWIRYFPHSLSPKNNKGFQKFKSDVGMMFGK